MRPFTANGEVWRVVRVAPGDPRLIDREGIRTVGTTDPNTRTVHLSEELAPPMLDRVMLHEVAHAIAASYGLDDMVRRFLPEEYWVPVEEWVCHMMETYGIEAAKLASESLGRPVCVRGFCDD